MLVLIFCRFNLNFYEGEVIKMCNVKNFLAAMLLVFAVTVFGNAEAAIVTDKVPLQCYVDHKVTSYDTGSGQAVGWIDAEVDLVRITGIGDNGVAIGTHPGRNGTVERLFWARDVFADTNYSNRIAHVNGYQQVYRTQNSGSTIGSVRDEDVTVVADNGNRAQIIYRLDNGTGYKMGWVPSSVVPPNPGPTPNNKLQDLINRWNGHRWVDHTYSQNSKQCKEFAQYIFNELYGIPGVGSGSTSDNPTNWRLNNTPSSIYQVAEVPENRNASQAKEQFRNLFAQAQPGDFIQIKRGHGGAHSAIFVGRTGNGIQWFDANADGNNGIKLQTYSYDDLVRTTSRGYQWNVAMSLYRAR